MVERRLLEVYNNPIAWVRLPVAFFKLTGVLSQDLNLSSKTNHADFFFLSPLEFVLFGG